MSYFKTELVEALVSKKDVTEVFRSHLESAMNDLRETELTGFLDYEKYNRAGIHSVNSRNGSYSRTLRTEFGELHLAMPRDQNESSSSRRWLPTNVLMINWNPLSFICFK